MRLFQFSDGKQVWKKGSLLSKNNHLALIKQRYVVTMITLKINPIALRTAKTFGRSECNRVNGYISGEAVLPVSPSFLMIVISLRVTVSVVQWL